MQVVEECEERLSEDSIDELISICTTRLPENPRIARTVSEAPPVDEPLPTVLETAVPPEPEEPMFVEPEIDQTVFVKPDDDLVMENDDDDDDFGFDDGDDE